MEVHGKAPRPGTDMDTIQVPVKIFGEVVGSAMIGPRGQMVMDLEPSLLGRELKDLIRNGYTDGLSISAKKAPAKQKKT